MKFLEAFANVFRIPDLRKRVLFTLAMLAVYRLGGHLPIPGVDAQRFEEFIQQNQGTVFGFFDLFSGGTFRRLTIFALGIMPYITSSIILQLLTVVVPTLEKLQKEGELGRRKITQWTRYLTVILALVQSFGIASLLQGSQQGFVTQSRNRLHPDDHPDPDHRDRVHHVAGRADHRTRHRQRHESASSSPASWSNLPAAIVEIVQKVQTGDWPLIQVAIIMIMMIAVVGFIVLVERGERRIPVQYAKRVIGRSMLGGQSTHMPLKVNAGGVIPVIFASSLLAFPQTALQIDFVKNSPVLSQHAERHQRSIAACTTCCTRC